MLSLLHPPRRVTCATTLCWGQVIYFVSVAVFAVLSVTLLCQPVRWLLGFVADDAFYYLQTARHIAATGHSTFDGLDPTNGYHPGWMLLMTLCAKAFPERVALLKASLGLEFAFHVAGSVLLARVLRPYLGGDWSWLGGAGWLLNPFPISLSLNGVEAPLVVFSFLLVVRCWQTRIAPHLERRGRLPVKDLVLMGAALAAAIYARTDQALVPLGVLLALMAALRRQENRSDRVLLRAVGTIVGTSLICLLPWLIYSYVTVGTVQQDSGAMKMLWHHRVSEGQGPLARVSAAGLFLWDDWLALPVFRMLALPGSQPPLTLLIVLALLGLLGFFGRRHPQAGAFASLTAWTAAYVIVTGLIYGIALTDYQRWHFAVPALLMYLVLFGWLALALQSRITARALVSVGLGAFALVCVPLLAASRSFLPFYPWQRDVYDSQPRFNALVPAGARIGCLNAGIPAFFSDRPIINLDGLVNHTVVAYWRRGEFDRYLRDQHIEYIADEPASAGRAVAFSRAVIPSRTLATAPLTDWQPPVRVLWRINLARIVP